MLARDWLRDHPGLLGVIVGPDGGIPVLSCKLEWSWWCEGVRQ